MHVEVTVKLLLQDPGDDRELLPTAKGLLKLK